MTYTIDPPAETEYAPFYAGYISKVSQISHGDIIPLLESQTAQLLELVGSVPAGEEMWRYAPGKWSIREVVGHMIDGERVFGYRAFRFSRNDATPLAGFDEDHYITNGWFDACPLRQLAEEFHAVRQSNLLMFSTFPQDAWTRRGIANGNEISVRALAYIMAGHVAHHLDVLRERYVRM